MKKGNKQRQNRSSQKATEKKEDVRSREILGMLPNPRPKKDNQENCYTCLKQIFFCVFLKNRKILVFQGFFPGNNFRDCHLKK